LGRHLKAEPATVVDTTNLVQLDSVRIPKR
jgi:hypothetical protein